MSFSTDPVTSNPVHPTLGTAMHRLKHRWGWFVAFGGIIAALGVVAVVLVVSATIASVYTIAVFMIIAGGSEIMMGVGSKTWGRFFLWIIAGLFYILAGAFALARPLEAAAVFTLMLGAGLLGAGLVRIYIGTHLAPGARGLAIFAGVVTAVVGLFIILAWPVNTFWVLGTLLGLDLLFSGISWIGLGLRLRHHA